MRKAGGIVAIIAGIFGILAAIVTLFVGGLGSALQTNGAGLVVGLGWGGILFSFLVIVFGAVVLGTRSSSPSVLLILSAIGGGILGGTLVAVFMGLALIGGILTLSGGKSKSGGAPRDATLAKSSAKDPDPSNNDWNPDEMIARYLQKSAETTSSIGVANAVLRTPRTTFGKRQLG